VEARVSALTPSTVTLPPIVGTAGSLNVIVGIVESPGHGEDDLRTSDEEAIAPPARSDVRDDVPLGSGDGLVDAFFEMVEDPNYTGKGTRLIKVQTITSVLAVLDEGAALAELGSCKSSTLLSTLRSAWTGETLGSRVSTSRPPADTRATDGSAGTAANDIVVGLPVAAASGQFIPVGLGLSLTRRWDELRVHAANQHIDDGQVEVDDRREREPWFVGVHGGDRIG
jgi:hypothetical protein